MFELMCISWHQEPKGTLPAKLQEISGYFPGKMRDFSRIFAGKLQELWPEIDGRLVNEKMFQIGQEFDKAHERRSKAGKKGNEKRWGTQSQSDRITDTDTDTDTDKNKPLNTIGQIVPSKPKSKSRAKSKNKKFAYPDAFGLFWDSYPRKVSKGAALKAWNKAIDSGATNEDFIRALKVQEPHWSERQFIPHAATWLNARRWEDDPASSNGTRESQQSTNREAIESVRRRYHPNE